MRGLRYFVAVAIAAVMLAAATASAADRTVLTELFTWTDQNGEAGVLMSISNQEAVQLS